MTFDDLQRDNWKGGQLLAFSGLDGVTDFKNALTGRTAFGVPGIDIKLPAYCGVRFPRTVGSDNAVAGDWFRLGTGPTAVQGAFLDTYHLLIEGPCEVASVDPAIAFITRDNRTLAGSASHFDAARIACDTDGAGLVDYDNDRRAQSPVLSSAGFLPLICGAASEAQTSRLADHLLDPMMFGTPFPVPSIAVKDKEHYAKDMWRGPVWINLNWLIAAGFDRYGLGDVAATLKGQTMKEIEECCEKYGVMFEFYDDRREVAPPDLLRKGMCAPEKSPYNQVFYDYGWTASLYADLVYSGTP